ncbi:LADA_0E00408g1_1 [Lachancea dasiensis]|uniref:LADA_0E00408g1_1 n=1 Tax=Lachancea dasiensis TaxID=1072105 RepID=A0A1G4JA42_9SACH|nr:LADA_0E00408g1_1 [Lachancea dasiensis]
MQKYVDDEETALLQGSGPTKTIIHVNSRSEKVYLLCSLYIGVLLAALDGTVVASLLYHIASELGSLSAAPWIASTYMMVSSAFQPLFGKLSTTFGRKQCLLTCHFLFALGSLLSGLSNCVNLLILGRCVQGIGGGGLIALSSIIVSDITPLRERGVYQGIGNISFGIGASLGGSMGGIISNKFGWRYAFLGQIVVSFAAICLVYLNVNETMLGKDQNVWTQLGNIDFLGSFFLLGAFICFFLGLNLGGSYMPWKSPQVVILFLSSLFFSISFFRAEQRRPERAIIPLKIFYGATGCLCCVLCLLSSMAAFSYIFHLPIFMEIVLGRSASYSGIVIALNFVGVLLGSLGSGLIMKTTCRYKRLLFLCGLLYIVSCGNLWFFDSTTSTTMQMLTICCLGLGYSSIITISLVALMAHVPPDVQAISSSVLYASRGFGSTVGVAVSSSIFAHLLRTNLQQFIDGPERKRVIELVLSSSDAVKSLPAPYKAQTIQSYLSSLKVVFAFVMILSILIWLASLPLKEHNLSRATDEEAEM